MLSYNLLFEFKCFNLWSPIVSGGYDPLTHGGYGAVDDYAPYPHLVPSASPDYSRNSNNPSRQDYTPDKARRREHHIG